MRIVVFPGDKRQNYLAGELEKKKQEVILLSAQKADVIGNSGKNFMRCMEEVVEQADVLVLPTPSFTQDGKIRNAKEGDWELDFEAFLEKVSVGQCVFGSVIGKERMEALRQKGVKVYDMMTSEEVALRNAVATAEGAICEAICSGAENLQDAKCLVIGFGRCGSVLAHKLKGLCKEVAVLARRSEVRTQAKSLGFESFSMETEFMSGYQYIFNTVPAGVLLEKQLKKIDAGTVIIDLASAPGGVDYEYCKKEGITAKLCSGLPGKYAPKTSGIILADEIERSIGCRE